VERKTAFDFVTAIIQKRFYLQLQRLKAAFTNPLYLIEGRQLYGLRRVHPNFALPLVGRMRAEAMLAHFGTIERLAAATEKDLAQIPGIGAKTAAQVRQVLSAAFGGTGRRLRSIPEQPAS
jgi:ERCC4-type nuclease